MNIVATAIPLATPATASSAHASLPVASNSLQTVLIYWHLLSLDAPTVAMLWTWFIAKTFGIQLPQTSVLAMGVVVWILYAVDRLLDSYFDSDSHACPDATTSSLSPLLTSTTRKEVSPIQSAASRKASLREADRKDPDAVFSTRAAKNFLTPTRVLRNLSSNPNLEPRHLFHRLHRRAFLTGIAFALLLLIVLVPLLPVQSLRLDSVLGILLLVYLALIHNQQTVQQNLSARLPKEIAVGIFFSAASFIPTIARNPALWGPLLPAAILFGLICSLNCLFIYAWEHPAPFAEAHPATRLTLSRLTPLAGLTILASFTLAFLTAQWQLPCAAAGATFLLLVLHINRRHFNPTTLRAAADLCLLTPIAFVLTLT